MSRAISPLDGRYAERLADVSERFSEYALMRGRCEVELRYLEALDRTKTFPRLTDAERARIAEALESFDDDAFARIKQVESTVRHDVKACELFLRERLDLASADRIHFGLTSEDVNNLAYGLLLTRFRDEVQLPQLARLIGALRTLADRGAELPFPARTHGQPASPTTAGKEIAVFLSRLLRQAEQLRRHRFRGKLNGATGNYAAHLAAFPEVDWEGFSESFVTELGLEWNRCTTQIEDHDAMAEYFDIVARINRILLDLDLDLWQYISRGEVVQRAVDGEVGSSTMPHKVNPIRFENSEGNVRISNALLHALVEHLGTSRMQRDLSDSTVQRNIGVALGHAHLAAEETIAGLERIDFDPVVCAQHLAATPEVLTEAVQTILRTIDGIENPYEALRALSRGRSLTLDELRVWVSGLEIPDAVKDRLLDLTPAAYIGRAAEICRQVIREADAWLAAAGVPG
jgi:adenylosuccinate lyase